MSLADRIIVMNLGAIEQVGTPEEIYQSPRTSFVAGFIGRTNWFHGQILGDPNGGTYRLTTDAGTALVIRKSGAAAIGKCSVCIRPERIAVLAPGVTTYGLFENLLVGQVVNVINMGAEIQYVVEGPDGRVMIIESNREGPKVKEGDRIHFGFRPEDCVILPHSPS
jgi:ABC-type Fe3+/spermidine/putrescine transport system ATPase subunit